MFDVIVHVRQAIEQAFNAVMPVLVLVVASTREERSVESLGRIGPC